MTYTETLNPEFMDMMGSGYVIDHCISAFQKRQEEKALRIYVTDALKVIADNTQRCAGGGYKMHARFYDIMYKKKHVEKKEETADEIILRIKRKIDGCV